MAVVFEKWEMMVARVNKTLKENKNLYSLFFKTESLFNCYNDFFNLKELLVYHLIDSELNTLEFKKEVKHFLKDKLQTLKLREEEENKEMERVKAILEAHKDEEFPF